MRNPNSELTNCPFCHNELDQDGDCINDRCKFNYWHLQHFVIGEEWQCNLSVSDVDYNWQGDSNVYPFDTQEAVASVQTECSKCKDYCPSGTLANGLCSDCYLIGNKILVRWARFGKWPCVVTHVSKNHTVYACRLYANGGQSKPRAIEFRGGWQLKGR